MQLGSMCNVPAAAVWLTASRRATVPRTLGTGLRRSLDYFIFASASPLGTETKRAATHTRRARTAVSHRGVPVDPVSRPHEHAHGARSSEGLCQRAVPATVHPQLVRVFACG